MTSGRRRVSWHPHLAERMRATWSREPGSPRAYALVTLLTLGEGVLLAAAPRERTSSPSFSTINELGGPRWFGLALMLLGVVLVGALIRSHTAVRIALMVNATLHLFLSSSFAIAAYNDHRAGLLGVWIYLIAALWMLSQREMYRASA